MPGAVNPHFSLTSLLTPRGRPNLAAFMAVNSDPLSQDYGKIQLLQLPQDTSIPGPDIVQQNFESYAPASEQLSLLRSHGSKVIQGNLITVPLGGGLLSIEPVYVQASSQTNSGAYPQLRKVFTFFNGSPQVGFANTLTASLAQSFGTAPPATGGPPTSSGGHLSAVVLGFLAQAEKFYNQAQAALRANPPNFTAYGQDIAKMKAALDQAQQAATGATGKSGKPPKTPVSPSPSASPTPSKSP
jgi:uncharacterized membrane protein (UPF0182 family)